MKKEPQANKPFLTDKDLAEALLLISETAKTLALEVMLLPGETSECETYISVDYKYKSSKGKMKLTKKIYKNRKNSYEIKNSNMINKCSTKIAFASLFLATLEFITSILFQFIFKN